MGLKRKSSSFVVEEELRDLLTYECSITGKTRCPPFNKNRAPEKMLNCKNTCANISPVYAIYIYIYVAVFVCECTHACFVALRKVLVAESINSEGSRCSVTEGGKEKDQRTVSRPV